MVEDTQQGRVEACHKAFGMVVGMAWVFGAGVGFLMEVGCQIDYFEKVEVGG